MRRRATNFGFAGTPVRMLLFAVLPVPLALTVLLVHQFTFTGCWLLGERGATWSVLLASYLAAGGPSVLFAFLMNWLDRRGASRRIRCLVSVAAGAVASIWLTEYASIAAELLRVEVTTMDFFVLGAAVGPATVVLVDLLVPRAGGQASPTKR